MQSHSDKQLDLDSWSLVELTSIVKEFKTSKTGQDDFEEHHDKTHQIQEQQPG